MSTRRLGEAITRSEDLKLLRGEGGYLDDVAVDAGALEVAFLRAPVAHARFDIRGVDTALALPGVVEVITIADLGKLAQPLPQLSPHDDLPLLRQATPLARDVVRYVGEPIAMVLATDRYVAEDAAELIDIEFETLPVAVELAHAAAPDAPRVHQDIPGNVAGTWRQRTGEPEAAFARADVVLTATLDIERSAGMPMEPRGVVASFDAATGDLVVFDSTQAPAAIRQGLAGLLGIPESRIRVTAPDVGGGFGTKVMLFYPEELLVPWAAMRRGGTVKWVEDRAEHFVGSHHERRQLHEVAIAASRDGRVLAVRDHFLHDGGAYMPYGADVAAVTAGQIAGPYRIPNIEVSFKPVYTNTTPVSPYRGCGRPQACFVIETMMDRLADKLSLDRAEIRRRNLIGRDEFPYPRPGMTFVDGSPVTLDSGDYQTLLDQVLDDVGYAEFPAAQLKAREEGRLLGLGMAFYVEATGLGPYEGARVDIRPDGVVEVFSGTASAGQSHQTTLAQVVADRLGVPVTDVRVRTGDTGTFPNGAGAYASRTAVTAGNAADRAAVKVRDKVLRLAAHALEVSPTDLEIADGGVRVTGTDTVIGLGQLAAAANPILYGFEADSHTDSTAPIIVYQGIEPLPTDEQPGLAAEAYYSPPGPTWASGVHAAIIEIDPITCGITWHRYACAHDCGTVINPAVVDGQVLGGIAQGLGGSFYERLDYDFTTGALRNGSFMDFLVPYATEVPTVSLNHLETPSPLNDLGIKGVGEAGAIPVPAMFASAVQDALRHIGISIDSVPLSPTQLHDMISSSASRHSR